MRSFNRIALQPASLPLSADDILEFHAARLLLLLQFCGIAGRIEGLTKMAKLDFFARYPDFFDVARGSEGVNPAERTRPVESVMIRHHYGPWDKRYYHLLAALESKQLVTVVKEGKSFNIALTPLGEKKAKAISEAPSFQELVVRMKEIKQVFGNKKGNYLKQLIYKLFDQEVADRKLGEVIGV